MNDVFSAKRFTWLLRKTIAERPIQTAGVTILLLVLSFILYVVLKKIFGFGAAQNLAFSWGLVGGAFFLSSFVFGYFGTNASGSSYLTLPASFFEKWLCGILIAGILYPIIFLLFFHIMDVAFVAVYHRSLDPNSLFYKQQYESVYPFDLNGLLAWKNYSMFLWATGAMLTGSLYFNKIAFVKTAIVFCVILFLIFGGNWLIAGVLFHDINDAAPYNHVTLNVGKETGTLILPAGIGNFFRIALLIVTPIVLWFLPLLRLREKEF
jgi:hypothetical protein